MAVEVRDMSAEAGEHRVEPRRVLLVYNSKAGLRRAGCSDEIILGALRGWKWDVTSIPCRSGETTRDVAAEIAGGAYDLVVGAGGDGTLNLIANALAGTGVPLGIVPCGTANDLALTLNIPLEIDLALELIRHGSTKPIDLGKVNDRYFLNVASVGLSARVAHDLKVESKRRWGKWAYVIEGMRQLRGRRSERIELCLGNSCESVDAYQVSVANGASFGGGWRVDPTARADDGKLDVLVMEKGTGRDRFRRKRLSARPTTVQRFTDRSMRLSELTIVADGDVMMNLDGESVRLHPPLRFEVAPASLQVYAPEAA